MFIKTEISWQRCIWIFFREITKQQAHIYKKWAQKCMLLWLISHQNQKKDHTI